MGAGGSYPGHRATTLTTMVAAARMGRSDELVAAFDAAVSEGMAVLGFARAGVRGVQLTDVGRGWLGRKHPTCVLELDLLAVEQALRLGQADRVLKTWVHESVHGRAPFGGPPETGSRGYEEGLAEGIALHVVGKLARVELVPSDYTYCVAAYRALAASIGVEAERLWRDLWAHPAGRVRAALPGVVRGLLGREVERLLVIGDQLFSDRRLAWTPDPAELARSWALVLR